MTGILLRQEGGLAGSFLRLAKAAAVTVVAYLLQACVAPHLRVAGVVPSFPMVAVAILTVSMGRLYAFGSGALLGILLEAMASGIPLLYVLIYPSLALIFAQAFADMSDYRREMRGLRAARQRAGTGDLQPGRLSWLRKRLSRMGRTAPGDLEPHLRIVLNALSLTLSYEVVMLLYIALDGVSVSWNHLFRVLVTLILTLAACALMFPARWFLGIYAARKRMRERVGPAAAGLRGGGRQRRGAEPQTVPEAAEEESSLETAPRDELRESAAGEAPEDGRDGETVQAHED